MRVRPVRYRAFEVDVAAMLDQGFRYEDLVAGGYSDLFSCQLLMPKHPVSDHSIRSCDSPSHVGTGLILRNRYNVRHCGSRCAGVRELLAQFFPGLTGVALWPITPPSSPP